MVAVKSLGDFLVCDFRMRTKLLFLEAELLIDLNQEVLALLFRHLEVTHEHALDCCCMLLPGIDLLTFIVHRLVTKIININLL